MSRIKFWYHSKKSPIFCIFNYLVWNVFRHLTAPDGSACTPGTLSTPGLGAPGTWAGPTRAFGRAATLASGLALGRLAFGRAATTAGRLAGRLARGLANRVFGLRFRRHPPPHRYELSKHLGGDLG